MKKILFSFLAVVLILFTGGCAVGTDENVGNTGGTVPTQSPSFQVEITPLCLPDYDSETFRFIMMDADGTRILYSLNRKEQPSEELSGSGYFITEQVVLYDAAMGVTVCTWIPETPGYYFAGALGAGDTAVIAGTLDYTNFVPQQNAVYCFGEEQTMLFPPAAEVNYFRRLNDGSVIFSFANAQAQTGVCQVKDGICSEILVMNADEGTVPYAGMVSSCGTDFSYVMGQDGVLTLNVADPSGIQTRNALKYQEEKLDSCCLTEYGIFACLSVNEGTIDACRCLVLYDENGQKFQLKRAADSALYRMQFGKTAGVAVNSKWQLYLIGIGEDHIACASLQSVDDQLQDYDKTTVFTFSTQEGRVVLYFQDAHKLFLLDVSYE